MTFKYDKDNLFKEFAVAKEKDIKLSKKETLDEQENDVHTNRIQFFKDHIELKNKNPQYYSDVDINFENLLKVYQSESPRDTFYRFVFGKTFEQVRAESEPESLKDF